MEKVTLEKQLKIITNNKAGMLADVAGLIADKGINIENFCAYASGEKAVFHLLTNDNEKAKSALQGKGYQIEENKVILLRLWNRPGSLASVAAKLKLHGINLEHVYGTSSLSGERMTVIFSSDNNEKASEIFSTMIVEEGLST